MVWAFALYRICEERPCICIARLILLPVSCCPEKATGYFLCGCGHNLELRAACYADKKWISVPIFLHHGNKIRCIIENRMV